MKIFMIGSSRHYNSNAQYKITAETLKWLELEDISEDVRDKLKKIQDQVFEDESQLTSKLEEVMPKQEFQEFHKYKECILKYSRTSEKLDTYRKACEELGAAFVKEGHTIIVCGSSPNTVDPYVVKGVESVDGKHNVYVYRPSERSEDIPTKLRDLSPLPYNQEDYRNINFKLVSSQREWRHAHLRAIHDCDVLVALGGSPRGTGPVIYSAEVVETPVVLIPQFQGLARETWRDFIRYYSPDEQRELLDTIDFSKKWGERIVKLVIDIARRNPFSKINFKDATLKGVVMLLALTGWFVLFSSEIPSLPPWLPVFLMMLCASLVGSLMRNILRVLGAIRTKWMTTNIFLEVLLGLGLTFAIFLLPHGLSYILDGEPATLENLGDIQRVGICLSVLCLCVGLFPEEAWQKLASAWKERLNIIDSDFP